MKIIEIDRTANVAWSPQKRHPIYLAAATAAQQLDATFNTSACLELYKMSLSNSLQEMELQYTINIESRLHRLAWSPSDNTSEDGVLPDLLIGGAEQGKLFIWNPNKILESQEPLVHKLDKHTGAVISLDVNPFQSNLLASGAGDSEIFIWDLSNPDNPMTPGSKIQPSQDVSYITWNRQVQHILSSSHGGNCVVWDLRKNEPIIKIRDSMSRMKCNAISWHPEVATQLCISSEDDHSPCIQVWDLRSATSPLKLLEGHTKGILSMAWCSNDANLLMTSSKDNKILWWNPNANEARDQIVYEMCTTNQWCYDVQWCPRLPCLVSGCSFDGRISVYNIMGGSLPDQISSKVADAFAVDPSVQQNISHHPSTQPPPDQPLKVAPKWMKRPAGCSFAFGGKLVTFTNEKLDKSTSTPNPNDPKLKSEVLISQVVIETDFVNKSLELEKSIENGRLVEFCDKKINNSSSNNDLNTWKFLKARFESDMGKGFLHLLGHEDSKLDKKTQQKDIKDPTQGDFQVDQEVFLENLVIQTGEDVEGKISECLLVGDFKNAVDLCLENNLLAEALILAISGGVELLVNTKRHILGKKKNSPLHQLISCITNNKMEELVKGSCLDNWREILTSILTYTSPQDLPRMCDLLGERLENSGEKENHNKAALCYIVAGNVDRLVENWKRETFEKSHHQLQNLIEQVTVLQHSKQEVPQQPTPQQPTPQQPTPHQPASQFNNGPLAQQIINYSQILSDQGRSSTALKYLQNSPDQNDAQINILKDRLFYSLSLEEMPLFQQPPRPFNVLNITKNQQKKQQPQNQYNHEYQQQQQQQQIYPQQQKNQYLPYQQQQQQQQQQIPSSQQQHQTQLSKSTASQPHYNLLTTQPLNPSHQPSPFAPFSSSFSNVGPQPFSMETKPQVPNIKGPMAKYHHHSPASSSSSSSISTYPHSSALSTSNSLFTPSFPNGNINLLQPSTEQNNSMQNSLPQGPSSYQPPKPATAWNDPPMLTTTKPKKTEPTQASSYEGLLYNPQQYQQQHQQQYNLQQQQYYHQQYPQQPQQPQQLMYPQQPQQPFYPQQPQSHHSYQQLQGYTQVLNPSQNTTPNLSPSLPVAQEIPKKPLPEEYHPLKSSFDNIISLCSSRATNLPTRKKMDDVSKRLEVMYSKLAESKISPPVISGLTQISQLMQQFDFNSCLHLYSQLVNNGSFSEISSFGPSIKVLLQTAIQLHLSSR